MATEASGRDVGPPTKPGGLHLRPADLDDVDAIGELTVRAYVDGGFVTEGDDYAAALRDAARRLRGAELWVATIGGGVRGSVTFCPPGSAYRELARAGEGELRMLAVDPAARGLGLGRALIGCCLDRCAELGLDQIVLCSMAEMAPAHMLYESMGFSRDPGLDWQPVPRVRLLGFRAAVNPRSSDLRQ